MHAYSIIYVSRLPAWLVDLMLCWVMCVQPWRISQHISTYHTKVAVILFAACVQREGYRDTLAHSFAPPRLIYATRALHRAFARPAYTQPWLILA
jgi:hypothetical protein